MSDLFNFKSAGIIQSELHDFSTGYWNRLVDASQLNQDIKARRITFNQTL